MATATATITGTICKADGSIAQGAQVRAIVRSTEQDQGGQVVAGAGVTSTQVEAFTDEAGAFEINLVGGATVLLEIPTINLRKEIVVPAAGESVDFTTLI